MVKKDFFLVGSVNSMQNIFNQKIKFQLKNKILLLFLIFFIPFILAIPEDLNINGKLTEDSGSPLGESYSMTFKIYDVPERELNLNTKKSIMLY
jgi:hypothetical protein